MFGSLWTGNSSDSPGARSSHKIHQNGLGVVVHRVSRQKQVRLADRRPERLVSGSPCMTFG